VVPFGIRPDRIAAWRAMERDLWGSSKDRQTRRNADSVNTDAVVPMMRDDVLKAL
jgi:hypothetical protein